MEIIEKGKDKRLKNQKTNYKFSNSLYGMDAMKYIFDV